MRALLSDRQEALVRLVHAAGRAALPEVLSGYKSQPLSAGAARNALDELARRGWLVRVRDWRARSPRAVAWAVSEEAVPHLQHGARLPWQPDPVPARRPGAGPASALATTAAAPPVAPPPYRPLAQPPYVPPPAPPLRAGALDFLKYPSHGACR